MSQENVEIVRRMWDAFLAADVPTALSFYAPDVEWDGTNLPDGHIGRGHEAILGHVARWAEAWDDWTVEVDRIVEAGTDQVVLFLREEDEARAASRWTSGTPSSTPSAATRSCGARASPTPTKPWKRLACARGPSGRLGKRSADEPATSPATSLTRGELLACLSFEHYAPRLWDDSPASADGGGSSNSS